jgi:Leucine-rich repeat (LRR) protein
LRLIESLHTSISKLTNLTKLYLYDNKLTSLPDTIGNLTKLKELSISDNLLESLPASIGNLTNLEELIIGGNRLMTLPTSIGKLKKLELFAANNNHLIIIPDSIGNLTNLTNLNLSHNQLTILPKSIGNLTRLKRARLNTNNLTSLPATIGNLTNLTDLHLYYNKLKSLPDSIGNLTNLISLIIYHNKLKSLPDTIGNLTHLEHLDIADNQLATLPERIGDLTELTDAVFAENELISLPASIGNLIKLESLDISNNKLTTIPKMPRLININEIIATSNPFTDPELIGKSNDEIQNIIFKSISSILDKFIGPEISPEYESPYKIEMTQNFVKQTQYKPLPLDNDELSIVLSLEPKPHIVYACPVGHLHSAKDCGIPTEIINCSKDCKLLVGGTHHMLVPGSYIVYHDEYEYAKIWYGNFPIQSYRIYKRVLKQANKSRREIGEPEIIPIQQTQEEKDNEQLIIARPLKPDDAILDMYLYGNVECKICGEDIILGDDNIYILPCGHLLHKEDVEGYREGNLDNIYEDVNGNDIADDIMGKRKCHVCEKQFAFGKTKSIRKTSRSAKRSITRKTSKRKTSANRRKTSRSSKRSIKRKTSAKRRKTSRIAKRRKTSRIAKRSIKRKTSRIAKRSIKRKTSRNKSR